MELYPKVQEMVQAFINSMPNRIQALIKEKSALLNSEDLRPNK